MEQIHAVIAVEWIFADVLISHASKRRPVRQLELVRNIADDSHEIV